MCWWNAGEREGNTRLLQEHRVGRDCLLSSSRRLFVMRAGMPMKDRSRIVVERRCNAQTDRRQAHRRLLIGSVAVLRWLFLHAQPRARIRVQRSGEQGERDQAPGRHPGRASTRGPAPKLRWREISHSASWPLHAGTPKTGMAELDLGEIRSAVAGGFASFCGVITHRGIN